MSKLYTYISRLACYACPVYIYFSGRTRVNAQTPPEKSDEEFIKKLGLEAYVHK